MARLAVNRGTTYTINVLYQRNGVATTLVGATVRFTMKSSEFSSNSTDADASVLKNVTNGLADGTATITINPADTAALVPGKYYYDIKVQDNTGAIYKLDEGQITLDGSPTNRLS